MFAPRYYVRAIFGSESGRLDIKNKDLTLKVLQNIFSTEVGIIIIPGTISYGLGWIETYFHNVWCFRHRQKRWIFDVFLMRSNDSLLNFCVFAWISNGFCNVIHWFFNDVLWICNVSKWFSVNFDDSSMFFSYISFVSPEFRCVLLILMIFNMF